MGKPILQLRDSDAELITGAVLDASRELGMTLGQLASVIHPYPSQGEISKKLGDAYMRTRLTPRVKGLFERWFRFLRR